MFSAKPRLHLCLLTICLALALLNSACLWGVVRDAESGEPIVGAEVKYTDVNGDTGTATTDANGLYAFDQATGPYPASGPVSFQLTAVGYQAQTAARLVQYNDNPNASFADLSSFWEVQNFGLTSAGMKITNIELLTADIGKAKAPPLVPGATARYFVTLRTYGAADPLNPACEQSSNWVNLTFPDPAPLDPANLDCIAPGKDFLVSVTVLVERQWTDPAAHLETDVSTATWGWETSTNSWQGAILDSTDTSGPDDSDLEFDASIRYRTATIIPLWCEE